MTQPSKGAALFLVLFGLPFLGAGLFFIYAQLAGSGNFGTGNKIFGVMFGSVFALIGGGLIYAAIGGYGRLKKQAAIEESNPLSPWLWRTDWAGRRAESLNQKSEITYWVIRIFCVRRVVTGSGDSSTTREAVLWQAEQNVPSGAVGPGALGGMIPVNFVLPAECYVTNHD